MCFFTCNCTKCRISSYYNHSRKFLLNLERRRRMEQNSRSSYDADFRQFSNFLRGVRHNAHNVAPCNSNNFTDSSNNTSGTNQKPDYSHTSRSLAMVYPVSQMWQGIYDPEIALINGTIFEELNKPFYPTGCSQNNGCRGNNRTGGAR